MRMMLFLAVFVLVVPAYGQSDLRSDANVEQDFCGSGIGYPGGQAALEAYIQENLDFSGIQEEEFDIVYCRLTISEEGIVNRVDVENTEHSEIVAIITRSFMAMPHWEPYIYLGNPSERIVRIPVRINWQDITLDH